MGPGVRRGVRAGAAYFAIVFALGFVLGTVRTLLLLPRMGESAAVLIELPIMLAASWWVCGWLLRGRCLSLRERLAMGVSALILLWIAEALLALLLGVPLCRIPAEFVSGAGAPGTAAQLAFAAFPLLRAGSSRGPRGI